MSATNRKVINLAITITTSLATCLIVLGIAFQIWLPSEPTETQNDKGSEAEEAVETARRQVADLINCDPREIVWTSGATESDNLAIKGAAHFYSDRGKHLITSKIEHKAVLDSCRQLENEGFEVTYLQPDSQGIIAPRQVAEAIRPDTTLVSLMHVNNEIGVVNDIEAIGRITRERGVMFHVDAAQSPGKIEIDLEKILVDLMSLTAHKIYGPKGIGALYVRMQPRVRIEAQMHGGGHERGMRSGTLATHQIVGMGEAFRIAREEMVEENARILSLRKRLLKGLASIEEIYINGNLEQRVSGNLNIAFNFVDGESLMLALRDLALSSGSACTSASLEPSFVLRALGLADELAHSSLRISVGRFTTEEEIDFAVAKIRDAVAKLRDSSPQWREYKASIAAGNVKAASQ